MKKLYSFMIALIATTVMSSGIYAQADLKALSDDFSVESKFGGYLISVNFQNIGNEVYTGAVNVQIEILGLDGDSKFTTVASVSNSNIEPNAKVGLGSAIHKDAYPASSYLVPGTIYNIKIKLTGASDANTSNDEAWLMDGNEKYKFYYYLDNPNAINDYSAENTGLNIYPNPVTNNAIIQFSLKQSSNVSLKIYNAIGGLVKEIENAQLSNGAHQYFLNTANFEKGMYFYVLETSEGRISKRFIKE